MGGKKTFGKKGKTEVKGKGRHLVDLSKPNGKRITGTLLTVDTSETKAITIFVFLDTLSQLQLFWNYSRRDL